MQINDQKIIKAHKYIRQVLQSEEYKRGLNSSEKEQLRQFFKQSIGKIVSEKNSEEFAEIEKLLTEEEKLHAQERKDVRANQGVLDNAANDILRATTRLPMAAVDLSAWLAQMVGANDTAQSLAQFSADKKYDIEQALPGAEFNAQNPDSWLPSADFISSTAIENLPLMLATGVGSKALIGGATKLSGAPLSRGITKALEITGTGIGMSLPETYSAAMTQDALGNVELPKSALVPAMMAIPHAAVEVGLGISPVKLADLGSKKFLTSNFVEKMSRYARRYGTAQAAKYTVNQLFGDGFDEGAEELTQGVIGIFNRNLANKDVGQAISDSVDELMEDKTWNDLYQQFVGGVTTGTVYSGGKSAIDRVSSNAIEKAKAGDLQGANADINAAINDKNTSITEKQDLAKQKEVLQLPYIISNSTADSLRDSDLNQSQIIHPFENWGGGNPYETVGTMDDYRRYKSEKEVNKPFPESPMALLNEFKALYGQNDNPRWQRLQEHVTNKYGTSQALAKEDYPAGKIGKALRALDEVETKPASANSFEYDPETDIPLLPYEPNKADGRQLPEGSIIKDSRNDDIITLKSGKPFKNEKIAKAFQSKKNLKDSHDITPVRGGFVLMKKPVLQEPRRVTVETPKEGNYQRGSEAYVSGITIPTENRTLVRGNSEAAARLEKKLPQQQPDIALPAQKLATAKDENTKRAILEDYNRYLASNKAAYEEYKSKPEVAAKIPGMQNVIKEYEAVKTAVENELANVHLPPESKITEQTDRKQWYIDADDKPVFTTKSDSMGYRGPYSKQEISELLGIDKTELKSNQATVKQSLAVPEPKAEESTIKTTEPVKQPATKSAYKVESYQGGFRVLDPEGKQYSWHTGRQAADDKAADLNSGKIAPVKSETKPVSKPETQPATRITAENAEMLANAQRLRKSAASLLDQAQADLNRDRQTNTARRARMAAGATDDALNREAFAKTMNNLADAMERGEVKYLKNVKSRPDLMLFKNELTLALGRHARKNDKAYDWYKKEPVTDAAIRDGAEFNRPHPYGDWFDHAAKELEAIQGMKPAAAYIEKLGRGNRSRNVSLSDDAIGKILDIKKTIAKKGIKTPYQFARILETVEYYQKLKAAGIKSDFDLADALIEYRNLEAGKKQESPLVKAERELIGKKFEGFDFFPTPPALAERMAQELDIKPGMKVLEPSAGKGDLADAVKAAQPEADVKVIEPLSDLREILTMKNHEVIDTNFENFETDQKFDRVIMNPPFSKNRDIRHVRKAYELLAPGGKMIAIMGNHFTFANDKESVEFRDWLDAVGGASESLGQVFAGKDAFRQTGVNSQLVTIEKPTGAGAKTTSNRKHSYSNTDVAVPKLVADKMLDLGKAIPVREIYTDKNDPSYGLETRPHITARYGLGTDNPADLRRLSDLPPITVEMGEVSIFETDKYDVVKVDIESEGLRAANKKVGELVEVPGETYKDYKPHATIAYVKKGEGKKYIGNKSLLGQTFEIDEINLVDRNGEEHPIKLTGKPVETRVRTEPGAIGKLSERINQFIEELKGRNLTPEQQGIYDVFTRKEKVYKIKDLKDVGEYVAVEGGRRKFGAQHVLIKHYGTNIGPVTAEEILQIGEIIRDGKVEFDGDTRIYTRPAEDGALLKVVVGKNRKDGSDTLITFHSKNRKAPTRATRESSALQGAFQKAETSATSNISAGPNEVKGPESDLIKPEEKDFGSATDYLKALTAWREKTGNITAAEAKRRDRALRFADRAAKTGQKASGLFRQADKISERFYMGQPILVGHHSERGARAAQNRMHNKMDAALKEEKKAEYYSQRAESAEKNKSISSADEDAIVKLKAKLESLSKVQERMKQANKVVKASKLSDAEKITKLQEQGFSEAKAKNLLEKDFAGRVGFPAYALQNNNAEMSRLKKRIEELSVKQSQQTQKIEFDGGEIVDNVAENRLQIFFDSKPDEATREKLKSNGFRWAPSAGAWQMHRSTWANRKAESITGAKIPAAQPAQAATAEDKQEIKPESAKEPLYSAEYLVARYAKRGLNKAGQVVKRGLDLIRQAGVTFARWARQMINDFGKAIRKHLRTLWTDLDNFNKRLGRTGAISGRSTGLKNGEVGQSSPPPGKTAQEILTDKWAKKGLEKAYRFGDKLYQAGKTTFADWQKYMRQRFKDIDASELTGLWNDIKNPELTLTTPLRDNSVRASAKAFKLLGVEPGPLYADYSGLWGKQKQDYFKSPEAVKAAVEYVLENPDFSTTEADGNAGLVREGDANEVKPFVKDGYVFEHPKVKIRLEKKQGAYHIRSVHLLNDQQFERDKNRRDSAPLDGGVTSDKLTERFTPDTSGSHQSQVDAQASSTKNDTPSGQKVKSDKSPTELKQMVTSRGLVWKRVDKDTYELELTDPNTGKTSVVETIRRPKGTDNIWNVDNWTTFDNKGTGSGSFTSLKVAKAAIKAHARDAFNQRIYRENSVVKDRQRDEALKKKRERGLEQDKERDAREAARQEKRKEKAEEFIAKGKKKKARKPEKPKTWRDQARNFLEKAEEVLFDAWAPIRRLQESIKNAAGLSELPEDIDLYQKLEVVAGKVEAGTRIFKDKYFKQIKDYLVENNIDYKAANRFLAIMHAEERNDAVAERNEAFRLTGAPGSGIETEQARKEIAEHKKNGTYEKFLKFAQMTYRLNNALLDEQVRYGLLSQKQRDAYSKYKYYTPMKSPPDQGFVLDKAALGRRSEATDQLAYIEKAIDVVYKRGERKQVVDTAARLFSKYANPKLYRRYEPDQVQYYDKRTGKVKLRTDTSKLYNNPAIIWSRDVNSGELTAFEIRDTGLQNALNRQYSDLSVEQKAFRYFAGFNRFLAGVATAYNPEFIFTNLIRDIQQGAASVGVTLPEGSVKKFMDNLSRAKKAIADARAGKITADTRLLEEFQLAGGKTGYSDFSRLEETAANLEREIAEAQAGGRWFEAKQGLIKVRDWIADWNDAMETRTRFAGYLTAKEAGYSTQKSAAFAKGMTINFNKKGTWATVFNSLYLFSSASLGGTVVTASIINKARKTPKGRAMIAGAISLGFVMELLNRAVAGDDDEEGVNYYDKVPDYIKDSNYVFMLPGTKGKYFAIPMPYGLNVLPSIGRNMAASMFGAQSFKTGAANVAGALWNSFNPLGGDNRGLFYQAAPTAVRPFVDIATNTTWTGRKLRPDQPAFGSKVAPSELYFNKDSKVLREVTRTLNELTGGDRYTGGMISLSPSDVGHLIESYTGGVGRVIGRSADTVTRIVTGEAPELDNIPLVRRFGGGATDYNTWQTFKANAEIVEDFERARSERNIDYLKSNRQLLPAVALYKNIGKRITAIRKRQSLSEDEKQKQVLAVQKLFNKKFKEMNEKALSKN